MNKDVAQIGACMSDLVVGVHALVTEREKGALLKQRVSEIKSSANAIIQLAEKIAKDMEF